LIVDHKAALAAVEAELLAADVCRQLSTIAVAQHRIACALASEHRAAVLGHLRGYGISEAAATAFINSPLSDADLQAVATLKSELIAGIGGLREKVRAIAVSS
jgi:hypothetical protein